MPRSLAFLLVLLLSVPLQAAAQALYTGSTPVASQEPAERAAALPEALRQVLRKQCGLFELPAGEGLDAALAQADRALIAFQYREEPRLQADGSELPQLMLQARFQPEAVDRMVRDLGLPRWRPERAPVVLWLVVDDGRGRVLAPEEYRYAWQRMEDVARERGLPVSWPELSEELLQQVDLQLLWGGYTEQLLSEGALADGVLVAAARRDGPGWEVRWTFADRAGNTANWQTRGALENALAEGAHLLVNQVASQNTIGPAGLGDWQVELLVEGMRDGADYARCVAYLSGLAVVDRVDVLSAGEEGLRFGLDLNAEPAYLTRMIEQDRVLEAAAREGVYRVRP